MNISAVSHRSTIEFCYASDENTVTVNIKTAKDVDRAFIISEDPFIHELRRQPHWSGVKTEMHKLAELKYHIIWTVKLQPRYKRLRYYFELESEGNTFVVCENKICPVEENSLASMQYFKYAWLNVSDIITPPNWVKHTVWYQIMPDRFCRSSNSPEDKKFRKWGDFSNPQWNDIYGGNIRGITERLGYLKDLGISGIYLTPIFKSGSNHKYNTFDYWQIDPDFGTGEDLTELVDTAHTMGIRVMLDAVFNHCGQEFFAWKDVCEKGRGSRYYDWFFINAENFADRNFSTEDGRFFSFSFWAGMPKLNTNNPEVVEYFTKLCVHWAKDRHIDGIRFDVGDEVSHTFINSLNSAVKKVNPDVYFLGEIWTDSLPWLGGKEYDSVMNYPLPECVTDFFKNPNQTFKDFEYALNYCRTLYPEQVTGALFNFLDTHDTPRVAEVSKNNDELLQKIAVIMTLPGSACIYYGTEIAMKGFDSPYNRATMPWDEVDSGKYDDIKSKISALIHLRNARKDFKSNEFEFIYTEDYPRLMHYVKSGKADILINAQERSYKTAPSGKILFQNGYENGELKPYGILIAER